MRGLEIFSCIILIVDNDDSIQRSLYTRKQVFIKQTPGMKGRICTGNYLVGLKVNVKKEGQQFYVWFGLLANILLNTLSVLFSHMLYCAQCDIYIFYVVLFNFNKEENIIEIVRI